MLGFLVAFESTELCAGERVALERCALCAGAFPARETAGACTGAPGLRAAWDWFALWAGAAAPDVRAWCWPEFRLRWKLDTAG